MWPWAKDSISLWLSFYQKGNDWSQLSSRMTAEQQSMVWPSTTEKLKGETAGGKQKDSHKNDGQKKEEEEKKKASFPVTAPCPRRKDGSKNQGPLARFNNWWGNWAPACQRRTLDPYLTPYTKGALKWIKATGELKPQKILEGNIGIKLLDLGLCNGFSAMTRKAQATKTHIKGIIQIKKFVLQREHILSI